MTLKGDNIGFRGQYQRGDVQIFLNKENFGDVITLEPIHKLIEQATFEDMNKEYQFTNVLIIWNCNAIYWTRGNENYFPMS